MQKKLETIEEKIDKVVEKINGEEQRVSKKLVSNSVFPLNFIGFFKQMGIE